MFLIRVLEIKLTIELIELYLILKQRTAVKRKFVGPTLWITLPASVPLEPNNDNDDDEFHDFPNLYKRSNLYLNLGKV